MREQVCCSLVFNRDRWKQLAPEIVISDLKRSSRSTSDNLDPSIVHGVDILFGNSATDEHLHANLTQEVCLRTAKVTLARKIA